MTHTILDTSGLLCPIPVLKAKKAMAMLKSGEVLEVISTDPGSVLDFKAFCKLTGHVLKAHTQSGGTYRFHIVRA